MSVGYVLPRILEILNLMYGVPMPLVPPLSLPGLQCSWISGTAPIDLPANILAKGNGLRVRILGPDEGQPPPSIYIFPEYGHGRLVAADCSDAPRLTTAQHRPADALLVRLTCNDLPFRGRTDIRLASCGS